MIELTKTAPQIDAEGDQGWFLITYHSQDGIHSLARLTGHLQESALIEVACVLASQYGYSRWSDGRTGIEHDSLTGQPLAKVNCNKR